MNPSISLNTSLTSERYGHVYHTTDGEEIHGIKKGPEEIPPEGSYARVKWARNLKTNTLLARRICVIKDPKDTTPAAIEKRTIQRDAAERTIQILSNIRDIPGIVPYHGYERYTTEDGKEKIVFIFDKATQDLHQLLSASPTKPLEEKTQFSFAKQLLEVLHRLKGAHGDLTPRNILEKDGVLWLTDFDFYSERANCLSGAIDYQAPEILLKKRCPHLRKKDVWACGMILFFIFTNSVDNYSTSEVTFPWLVESEELEAMQLISLFDPLEFAKVLEAKITSSAVRHLLSMMLQPDPTKRCTIDEAYDYFISYI